ncbi:hypothetical protein BgiBS90_000662 [Biomphalaria glabrata]|nr:hypothetical protein BgiBS90_000662 [Biomphalaria glabrata]
MPARKDVLGILGSADGMPARKDVLGILGSADGMPARKDVLGIVGSADGMPARKDNFNLNSLSKNGLYSAIMAVYDGRHAINKSATGLSSTRLSSQKAPGITQSGN